MDNEINLLTIAADIAGKVNIDKVDKDQLKLSEYYMQSDLEELRRLKNFSEIISECLDII